MILLAIALAFAQPADPMVVTRYGCGVDIADFLDEEGGEIDCSAYYETGIPFEVRPRVLPPGWDIGNSFVKDVCTEDDELAGERACYAAWVQERARLCAQEIVNMREGLIGTAPTNEEAGIGEGNPTPMCHRGVGR